MEFAAHIRGKDKQRQELSVHLREVAAIAAETAEKIGLAPAGRVAGLAHDLGKYSAAFQIYILSAEGLLDPDRDDEWVDARRLKGKIDHSSAGAQWIWQALGIQAQPPRNSEEKMRLLAAQMLALTAASHHGGLIDCVAPGVQQAGQDGFTRRIGKDGGETHLEEVRMRLDEDVRRLLQELLASEELVASVRALHQRISRTEKQHEGNRAILQCKLGLATRFLLSSLVEGDHRSSSEFESPETVRMRGEQKPDWRALATLLENALGNFSCKPGQEKIHAIRADIAAHCLAAAPRERGIYTLTVPTGGGKTLASLRFALHHAHEHGLDRIIYVIPFTSIIDQNARVVRGILEPEGVAPESVLLEHHSNLLPEKLTWRHKLQSENWDAPVIYTTSVQLLEALFGGGTRNARRMHALARAVLIFDEVQALPLRCAHLFANALNFLVEQAGSSAVLCTATQPLLHEIDHDHKSGREKVASEKNGAVRLALDHELMPDVGKLFADLKRTDIINRCRPGGWSHEAAAALAVDTQREFRSTLCIVNTRDAARQIFQNCRARTETPVFHLSTSMYPAHRREVLDRIRARLNGNEPVICVSTQLIEAGVDVSFGSVIRSMAGMDSIAQAAGRCNRNGELATPAPVFVINLAQENMGFLPEIADGQQVSERLFDEFAREPARFQNDLLAEPGMRKYFEYYFFRRTACMGYPVCLDRMSFAEKDNSDTTLLSLLGGNDRAVSEYRNNNDGQPPPYPLHQAFRTAAQIFRAIDSPAQGVVVRHGEGENIVAGLNGEQHPARMNELLRQAQQFSVNLFEYQIRALQAEGALHQTLSGIWYLDPGYYHPDSGVSATRCAPMETQMW